MNAPLAGLLLALSLSLAGCGGGDGYKANIAGLPDPVGEAWPALTPWPLESSSVEEVLAGPDGAQVHMIAYLVAVKVPCPLCNVGTNRPPREDIAGHTARPRGPAAPGCLPCPDPAATVGDGAPNAPEAASSARAHLRAIGVAAGLQPRHVGRSFLFVGVFHAKGANGPELEVTDVRALDGHSAVSPRQ
jgi:hypothetical protein